MITIIIKDASVSDAKGFRRREMIWDVEQNLEEVLDWKQREAVFVWNVAIGLPKKLESSVYTIDVPSVAQYYLVKLMSILRNQQ